MHWTRHPEFVTTTKLYVTLFLWFGYAILFFLRVGNRLYGSKFAKASIALFCLAILSLSFVNSKSRKRKVRLLHLPHCLRLFRNDSRSLEFLHLLGSSHRVADLAARERISLPPDAIDDFYQGLEGLPGLQECLILNTCNRTEIYGASEANFAPESLHDYLSNFRKIEPEFLAAIPTFTAGSR